MPMDKIARGRSSIEPSGFLASSMTRAIQAHRARDKVVARDLALGSPRSELIDRRDVPRGRPLAGISRVFSALALRPVREPASLAQAECRSAENETAADLAAQELLLRRRVHC